MQISKGEIFTVIFFKFEQKSFMVSDIKKEVLTLVEAIENEDLLQLLKADIEFFNKPGIDITDDLSPKTLRNYRNWQTNLLQKTPYLKRNLNN